MYQPTKDLLKYFEKLCNIKKEQGIKEAIKLEASCTEGGDYLSQRVLLDNYLNEEMEAPPELEEELLSYLKYYKECLAAFQKMARQVANNAKTFDFTPLEVQRLNELLNFKIPAPSIEYSIHKPVIAPEIVYPPFLPEEAMFPILSACTFFLCEIATKSVPYSLLTCDYVVPVVDRKARKPCGKILLQHNRGRKRKWCASHRTYRSKHKKC